MIQRYPTPLEITKARFSSYALGKTAYVIDGTDATFRDYVKHTANTLDPKKARKSWEKEIITKNCEVFEYLRLEIMSPEEAVEMFQTDIESGKLDRTLMDAGRTASFRVLVRKRADGSLMCFQETSVYNPMPTTYVPLGLKKGLSGKKIDRLAEESETGPWMYGYGVVSPVNEEVAKRIINEAPQFLSNLSIRDRW